MSGRPSFPIMPPRHAWDITWTLLLVLYNPVTQAQENAVSGSRADLLNEKISKAMHMFSGLEEIKDYFRNSNSSLAKMILQTFEIECVGQSEPDLPPDTIRKPFIVIEGNHKNSREVVGLRVANMLGGRYLVHPAPCLVNVLDAIPMGTLIRRAYYLLSLYATSFNIKMHLSLGRAVVLNGYWMDQLTFSLVQTFVGVELPSLTPQMINGPEGLLQPDLIFYLNLPDDLFLRPITTRSPDSWKRRVLAMYQELQTRHPIIIQNLVGIFRVTSNAVYEHMIDKLADKRDLKGCKPDVNFNLTATN